jgi:hypothetical protein
VLFSARYKRILQKLESDSMTKKQLWEHNVTIINEMNISAGSMIKTLVLALRCAGTNIKLTAARGHKVLYESQDGDPILIAAAANDLGITATDKQLTVSSG